MEQLETKSFDNKVNFTFKKRKKYLMLNLRIPEIVDFPSINDSFKLIYADNRWESSSLTLKKDVVIDRILNF
jgi:hypothetical protein